MPGAVLLAFLTSTYLYYNLETLFALSMFGLTLIPPFLDLTYFSQFGILFLDDLEKHSQ